MGGEGEKGNRRQKKKEKRRGKRTNRLEAGFLELLEGLVVLVVASDLGRRRLGHL